MKKGWVQFKIDEKYANGNSLRYMPKQYENVKYHDSTKYLMRNKQRFKWDIHKDKKQRLEALSKYHGGIRKELYYIYGDVRLWYIKKILRQISILLKEIRLH